MVRNAEAIARERGYQAIFADGHWDPEQELHAIESMICSRVRGALVCPCEKSKETIAILDRHKVPYVIVDTAPDDYKGALVGNNLCNCRVSWLPNIYWPFNAAKLPCLRPIDK